MADKGVIGYLTSEGYIYCPDCYRGSDEDGDPLTADCIPDNETCDGCGCPMKADAILTTTLGKIRAGLASTRPPDLPGVPQKQRYRIEWLIRHAHEFLGQAQDELLAHIKGDHGKI